MKLHCPNPYCFLSNSVSPKFKPIVRNGSSYRASDSRYIQRYYCRMCGKYFSKATFDSRYAQKKRRINISLYRLLNSGVSQRRAARLLNVNPKTVARRFHFLAEEARKNHSIELVSFLKTPLTQVQFDDLETSEHTKCKPLSVSLAVDPKTRKILGFQVSKMPAKGHLTKTSLYKYGPRSDERSVGWLKLMHQIHPYIKRTAEFTSDENPHYPKFLKHQFPESSHVQTPGGRGAIIGQGELKKLRFDPLFALNHTCAMLRANINRLFRKTWCTTKTIQGINDHLAIYMRYHNEVLTSFSDRSGGS